MLRKFSAVLCISVLLSMLCIVPATADEGQYAPTIAVSAANPDVINISGAAPENAGVTLTILNPGKTLSSLKYDDGSFDEAIAYTDAAIATNGTYKFNAVLLQNRTDAGAIGGKFTIIVNISGLEQVYTSEFEFYYRAAKFNVIAEFNQKPESEVLEKCIQLYSLQENQRWKNGEPQRVLTALKDIKASLSGQKFSETGNDAPVLFAGYLQQALLTAAVNSGKAELVSDAGGIHSDLLDYFAKGAVDDYRQAITDAGRQKVLTSLLTEDYKLMKDVADSFSRAVAFGVIASNVKQGYGHIDTYLTSYKNIYQSVGFDLETYNSLSKDKSNKNKFLSVFIQGNFSDLDEMKEVFNKTLKTYNKESGDKENGGKSTGSGTGGGKAYSNTTGEEGLITPEPIPPCPFDDMDVAPWAKEAVSVLYEKNIISGYNEKEYHPSGNVTRAEFTKLIMELSEATGKEEQKAEDGVIIGNLFDDVKDSDWFAPYVAKAASKEIVKGSGDLFRPNDTITRQDASVILYRLLGGKVVFSDTASFTDDTQISDYAKDAVAYLAGIKIINGMSDGSFQPNGLLTRAQTAVLIYSSYQALKQ